MKMDIRLEIRRNFFFKFEQTVIYIQQDIFDSDTSVFIERIHREIYFYLRHQNIRLSKPNIPKNKIYLFLKNWTISVILTH